MMNQVVLIGRITNTLELKQEEDSIKYAYMKLAVPRSFKNADGEYETDFIGVRLFGTIADSTTEYCKKGDLVGVKGRLQNYKNKLELVAEKLTFLSSKKANEDED